MKKSGSFEPLFFTLHIQPLTAARDGQQEQKHQVLQTVPPN